MFINALVSFSKRDSMFLGGKTLVDQKNLRIALVNPPPPLGAYVHYQSPLIGLAYIAAVLEKNGYEVKVIDCPPLKMTYESLKREIVHFKPDVVGITSVTVTLSSALQAARGDI